MKWDCISRFHLQLLVVSLTALFFLGSAQAQDQSGTPPKATDQSSEAGNAQKSSDQTTNGADNSTPDVTEVPSSFQVTQLGSAQWLEPNEHSLLHLGPLYASSISAFFLAADAEQFNAQNQVVTGTDYFGVLRTNVIYDKLTRAGRFTFQYLPEVAIDNGVLETNLSNQSLSFSIARALAPRWTLAVTSSLNYVNGHVLYGNANLDVNAATGGGVQNPFLQTTQRWLNVGTNANLGYQLSSRDTLSATLTYGFSKSDLSTLPQESNSYGGSFAWSHALSQTKSFGLFATVQELQYSTMFSSTLYKGFGGSFSDRLSATWVMQISASASIGNAGEQPGQNKQDNWTATGNATLRKDFLNSSVAFDAYRGITNGPFLTGGYTSRADASYSRHLGRRMQVGVGAAYEQDKFSSGRISGTYASTTISYLLSRSVSVFAGYARRWQNQNQSILSSGEVPANTFSTGLTWNLAHGNSGVISPVIY